MRSKLISSIAGTRVFILLAALVVSAPWTIPAWSDTGVVVNSAARTASHPAVCTATDTSPVPPQGHTVDQLPQIAHGTRPEPRINGPRVIGTTPGKPFLFLVPATGTGPLTYTATGLPAGVILDPNSGIISGSVTNAGRYEVALTVSGACGQHTSNSTIIAGQNKLALTPPMGFNSWQAYGDTVTASDIRQATDALIDSGLAAHGYSYVNIDDGWEGSRAANGDITTSQSFGNMESLAEFVHRRGLKIGIYSSPGTVTCAGHTGSYRHEAQDAATYASWGIDYLKYDLCSLPMIIDPGDPQLAARGDEQAMMAAYALMGRLLGQQSRDIVYSLCQYGMAKVWAWGQLTGGNLWRTTGDNYDSWITVQHNGQAQAKIASSAGPGHWNDPDLLVLGYVGWGHNFHATSLTPQEQVSEVSLWAIEAAPLLISCDLGRLDQWTIDVLSNDEVIDIDQDPLGHAGVVAWQKGSLQVWSRPLEDGSIAVGLFNNSETAASITARWSDLGISGDQLVRDVWQQEDLGTFSDSFTAPVVSHGVTLLKLSPARR